VRLLGDPAATPTSPAPVAESLPLACGKVGLLVRIKKPGPAGIHFDRPRNGGLDLESNKWRWIIQPAKQKANWYWSLRVLEPCRHLPVHIHRITLRRRLETDNWTWKNLRLLIRRCSLRCASSWKLSRQCVVTVSVWVAGFRSLPGRETLSVHLTHSAQGFPLAKMPLCIKTKSKQPHLPISRYRPSSNYK